MCVWERNKEYYDDMNDMYKWYRMWEHYGHKYEWKDKRVNEKYIRMNTYDGKVYGTMAWKMDICDWNVNDLILWLMNVIWYVHLTQKGIA